MLKRLARIFIQKFEGRQAERACAFTPAFRRRITLLPRPHAYGSRSTVGTPVKPIWGPKRVALALRPEGLDARLFLCGYELVGLGDRRSPAQELVAKNRAWSGSRQSAASTAGVATDDTRCFDKPKRESCRVNSKWTTEMKGEEI